MFWFSICWQYYLDSDECILLLSQHFDSFCLWPSSDHYQSEYPSGNLEIKLLFIVWVKASVWKRERDFVCVWKRESKRKRERRVSWHERKREWVCEREWLSMRERERGGVFAPCCSYLGISCIVFISYCSVTCRRLSTDDEIVKSWIWFSVECLLNCFLYISVKNFIVSRL